ncbi:polysaccharide pyruvyl transferase family protein [Exiguobacterium sp. UBA3968]|uniref:polysaccharide pyruvyl transferase family protein n=1 Tax=Exiguobacterium sp. UBA3968 TaxID=1946492 RepID=UPI0025BA1DAE|nr:polysaccharide pyruvyl transferase family protein [Exiguobacterium sp. UBA3968]
MKRIIIRAGMTPFEQFDAPYLMKHNSIGGNVGNLIYQYSIFRTLMTEGTTITPDYYYYDEERADEINANFDLYVIPLADAFRKEFVPTLRKYTRLIKKLKIPVVVIGVGLRAPFEPDLDGGFPFDEDVKAFVSAVLERSSMLGLRGEITSKYLTRLGFREGIDHRVIGCPSMYAFGRDLHIRETNITPESMITVNSSRLAPQNVLDFITRGMEEYPNHYFIPQWMKELKLTYTGTHPIADLSVTNYPVKMSDPAYMNDRVRFFLNAQTWFDFIGQADLSFGARLHGNITATLAGTPSILIPKDARMRELTDYHQLTHIWANDIKADTQLSDVVANADFQSPVRVQARNFDNFVDFLNVNDLEHIYQETNYPENVPFDRQMAQAELLPPVQPISGVSLEEAVARFERFFPEQVKKIADTQIKAKEKLAEKDKKIADAQKQAKAQLAEKDKKIKALQKQTTTTQKDQEIAALKAQLAAQTKKMKHQQGTLNRKAVRAALKTADLFAKK